MESKTPMIFVKHITAAQRGNENSIRYLCDHTSEQFIKICRSYNLTDSEVEAVLDKAYGQIFSDLRSVRDPLDFMNWASGLVRECCEETFKAKKSAMSIEPEVPSMLEGFKAPDKAKEPEAPASVKETEAVSATKELETPTSVKETEAVSAAKEPEIPVPAKASEPMKEPGAFYDENAYLEPVDTFRAELNYADETLELQTPHLRNEIHADSTAEEQSADVPVSEKSVEQILKEVAAAASSSEEEAIFEDYRPIRNAEPEVLQITSTEQPIASVAELPVSNEKEEGTGEEHESQEEPETQEEAGTESEVDIDVDETDSETEDEDDAEDLDDEDEEDGSEGILGLLKEYRARVLFTILGIFIFGACVGIGYAISRGLTSGSNTAYDPASVTEIPSIESAIESSTMTQTDSAFDSVDNSAVTTPTPTAVENIQKSTDSTSTNSYTDHQQAPANNSESADPSTREVTARPNIREYLGETFASVFRDYPNMSRSVYHGELSYANEFIGFIGSYDATKPVSSTIVESVSLLSAADDYNIDGFYIGMSSSDAEALASAGGYVEQDIPNEYVDEQGNILTLTIDGGTIRNATLRLDLADQVSMEMADEVPEEITNEGVG